MNQTATAITAEEWGALRRGDKLGVEGYILFEVWQRPVGSSVLVYDRRKRGKDTLYLKEDGRVFKGTYGKFLQPVNLREPELQIMRRPNTPREDAEIRWQTQVIPEGQTPITREEWDDLEENDQIHVVLGNSTTHPDRYREEIWYVLYQDDGGLLWARTRGWRKYPFTWKDGRIICHSSEIGCPFNQLKVFIWKRDDPRY